MQQPDTGILGQRHHLCQAASAVRSPPSSFAFSVPGTRSEMQARPYLPASRSEVRSLTGREPTLESSLTTGLGDCSGFLQKQKAAAIPAWSHQGAGALPINVSFQATSCAFLLSFGGAEAPFPAHCSYLLAWARWAALLAPSGGEARTRMALQVPSRYLRAGT